MSQGQANALKCILCVPRRGGAPSWSDRRGERAPYQHLDGDTGDDGNEPPRRFGLLDISQRTATAPAGDRVRCGAAAARCGPARAVGLDRKMILVMHPPRCRWGHNTATAAGPGGAGTAEGAFYAQNASFAGSALLHPKQGLGGGRGARCTGQCRPKCSNRDRDPTNRLLSESGIYRW